MMILDEGVRPPMLYGLAYRDYALRVSYFYPIPLNWFVQWGRSFYFWLGRGPGPNALDRLSPEARRNQDIVRHLGVWRAHVETLTPSPMRDEFLAALHDMLKEETA